MALDLNIQLNMSRLSAMQSQNAASQMVQNAADKARSASGASRGNDEEINEELMGACKQFEAYFLEQVFKEMEKSVDVFSKDKHDQSLGTLVDYFKDMTLQTVTSMSADQQSTGLAKMMYENLKNNYYASVVPVQTADAAAEEVQDSDPSVVKAVSSSDQASLSDDDL